MGKDDVGTSLSHIAPIFSLGRKFHSCRVSIPKIRYQYATSAGMVWYLPPQVAGRETVDRSFFALCVWFCSEKRTNKTMA